MRRDQLQLWQNGLAGRHVTSRKNRELSNPKCPTTICYIASTVAREEKTDYPDAFGSYFCFNHLRNTSLLVLSDP